jgi:transposase
MTRWKSSREFKDETVRLVTYRGVAVAQAARDLDIAESVLRRGIRELNVAPVAVLPENGQIGTDLAQVAALEEKGRPAPSGARNELNRPG